MHENNVDRRNSLRAALEAFTNKGLSVAATKLLGILGYSSEKTAELGDNAASLLGNIEQFKPELGPISRDKVKADRWKSCAFLFQLTNDEIPSLAVGQKPLGADSKLARGQIESFVFLAIELKDEQWSRTDLAAIARELNKRFPMPGILAVQAWRLVFSGSHRSTPELAGWQPRCDREPHHRH
jgi:adenine-specific DNA-methyltransferase